MRALQYSLLRDLTHEEKMPSLKDVTINITTISGVPLAEIGLQALSKFKRVSFFIGS